MKITKQLLREIIEEETKGLLSEQNYDKLAIDKGQLNPLIHHLLQRLGYNLDFKTSGTGNTGAQFYYKIKLKDGQEQTIKNGMPDNLP